MLGERGDKLALSLVTIIIVRSGSEYKNSSI